MAKNITKNTEINAEKTAAPPTLNYFDTGFVFVPKTDKTAVCGWKTPITGLVALAVPASLVSDVLIPHEVEGRWILVDDVDVGEA